jgi:hypothetical protein
VSASASVSPSASPTFTGKTTLVSDKSVYAAGESVTLSGAGWMGEGKVDLAVTDAKGVSIASSAVDVDKNGTITFTFKLPAAQNSTFTATAKGGDTGRIASAEFSAVKKLDEVSVTADKPDYAPSSLVTLKGLGWTGDETVNVVVNDTLGKTWKHDLILKVSDGGVVNDSFTLPDYFVSDYDVSITGIDTGRVATTTFTDTGVYLKDTILRFILKSNLELSPFSPVSKKNQPVQN